MIATGEDMAITQIEGSFPQDPILDPELKEEFIRKWDAVPDKKFVEWFRQWEKRDKLPDDAMVAITDWNECMHYLDDCVGLLRIRLLIPRPVWRHHRLSRMEHAAGHHPRDGD